MFINHNYSILKRKMNIEFNDNTFLTRLSLMTHLLGDGVGPEDGGGGKGGGLEGEGLVSDTGSQYRVQCQPLLL